MMRFLLYTKENQLPWRTYFKVIQETCRYEINGNTIKIVIRNRVQDRKNNKNTLCIKSPKFYQKIERVMK